MGFIDRARKEVDFLGGSSIHADERDAHRPAPAAEPADGGPAEADRGLRSGGRGLHGTASAPSPIRIARCPGAGQGHRWIGFLDTYTGTATAASGSAGAGIAAVAGATARHKQTRKQ